MAKLLGPEAAPANYTLPGHEQYVALADVLTPEFGGIDPTDYEDITAQHVATLTPRRIRNLLIGVPSPAKEGDNRSVIGYQPDDEPGLLWLAVTPQEYTLCPRSISALGRAAVNRTQAAAARGQEYTQVDPVIIAKAQRSGVHAVEKKLVAMENYQPAIETKVDLISRFREMTQHPYLSRGNLQTVGDRFTLLREVIDQMVVAMHGSAQWTETQQHLAIGTITTQLFLQPNPDHRNRSLAGFTRVADEYYSHKSALLRTKIDHAHRYVNAHTNDRE
jgi:hypothetical protein